MLDSRFHAWAWGRACSICYNKSSVCGACAYRAKGFVMSDQTASIVNSSVSVHESITFGGLYDRLKNKTLRLDAAYQRDAVPAWNKPEFLESVHDSVIRGVSLGGMCINVDSAGVWWAIDGGHRSRYISGVLLGVIDWVGGGKIADSPDDMSLFLSRVIPLEIRGRVN